MCNILCTYVHVIMYCMLLWNVNLSQNKWNNAFIPVILFKKWFCKSCILTILSKKWFHDKSTTHLMPLLWPEDALYTAWPVYGTCRTGPSSWPLAPLPPRAAVLDLLLGPGHRSIPSCSWNSASAEI